MRRLKCRDSTRTANTTSPASSSAWSSGSRSSTGAASRRATCSSVCHRPACTRTDTHSPGGCSSMWRSWRRRDHSPELGQSVGDALLATHRSYARAVRPLLDAGLIKGMAHITGGGITENLPRILPEGCGAVVSRRVWTVPPLFTLIQKLGSVADAGNVSRVQHGHRIDSGVRGVRPRACPGAPARGGESAAPPCWARWKPATAPCGISREPPPRRVDFRPRQQSSVDHRRHRAGRARCHGGGRDLESCRTPRASLARARRRHRRP